MKRKIFNIILTLVLALGFSLATAAPVAANGLPSEVWVDDDYCESCGNDSHTWGYDAFNEIQDGIDNVASPGTVHVLDGTYAENITLRDGVDVLGLGAGSSIIDGSSSGTVVYASGLTGAVILDGFTIQHGSGYNYYGGGMYAIDCSASLTVSNCTFTDNKDPDPYGGLNAGGGIYNNNCSSLIVTDCNFTSNEASAGGGIYSEGSSLTLDGGTFTSNSAYQGGGMNSDGSSLTLSDCDFDSNTAAGSGGGMYNYQCSSLTLTGCDFTSNQAQGSGQDYYGGGGMYNTGSSPTLSDCDFTNNTAAESGGGMHNTGSSPILTDCDFTGNSAANGGGMYNASYSSPILTGGNFTSNTATNNGGGMYNYLYSESQLTDCVFHSNSANDGGGMYNMYDVSLTVVNSTFWANAATNNGGGVNDYCSSPVFTNCTFYANTATTSGGGGMYSYIDPTETEAEVTNCIFWGDTGGEIVTSSSNPVVSYCNIQGGYAGGTDIVTESPLLTNPDFGDFHLQEGSPCIDTGTNSATALPDYDFEGNDRILEGNGVGEATADIGIDEYMIPNDPPNAPTSPLCEGETNPTAVADLTPEFSWIFSDPNDGDTQGAYQILVASTVENLTADNGDMWDSGKVLSSASTASYAGTTLVAFATYYWKVRTWDNYDDYGDYCSQQQFIMGPDVVWVDDGYCDVCENDGHTWGYDAFASIQDGIDAVVGSTVHVAAGDYHEDITLKNGVQMLGAGADVTTINGTGTDSVVTADGVSQVTLEGFTISGGSATYGGGMYNHDSFNVTVNECIFDGNTAIIGGGGMYNAGCSDVAVTDCTFSNNTATYDGGGMYNSYSDPTVTGCTFSDNAADEDGGGMFNTHAAPTITNCVFDDNDATQDGGGVCNFYDSPKFINCVFSNNYAALGGGMNNFYSTSILTNCTFWNNASVQGGSGMYNDHANATVTNCILWGDASSEIGNNAASPTVTYCDVQGGYSGEGNIGGDPLFAAAATGDFHLRPGSPCIDAGTNAAADLPATDFEGDSRTIDGNGDSVATVDMGVDERGPLAPEVWVDDDYDATTPGWDYDHFATVQDGVNAVASGGTVHIHPGSYIEKNVTIGKSLTIESVSGDWHDTIVDPIAVDPVFALLGEGSGPFASDVTISGLTIYHGSYGIYIFDGLAAGSTVTVENCLIYGNISAGIYAGNLIEGDIFIDDCIITQNGVSDTGIHLALVSGTVEITDSVVGAYWDAVDEISYPGNAGNGIEIGTISETGGVLIDGSKISENTGNGIADYISGGCYGQLTITNNVIGAYDYDLTSEDGLFSGNGESGIYIEHVGETGVVTIEGNQLADNVYGICFGGKTILGEVTINNNYIGAWTEYATIEEVLYTRTFPGNASKGIAAYNVAEGGLLVIINNRVAQNALIEVDYTGIYIDTTSGKTVILANHVGSWTQDIPGGAPVTYQGNGGPGILIENAAGGSLLIHGNTIADNIEVLSGIHIESADETAEINVHLNNILSNDGYGAYYNYGGAGFLAEINAENNWWGDLSGPGGEGTGSGDEVSTNVDYEPWLEVSVENALAGTITDGTLDNTTGAGTEVIVDGSAIVTVAEYSGNPGSSFSGDTGKYIDVFIDDPASVDEVEIRLYYSDDEIAGLVESSLVMRWWDGTGWVDCSDSGVTYPAGEPTYAGYIWARITDETTPNLTQLSGTAFGSQGNTPSGGSRTSSGDIGTAPPQISDVSLCSEGVTETTADICWITNKRSTSQVEYWASASKLSPLDETLVTEHHVQLTGLAPCTTYHYRTMSQDSAGNLSVSEELTFTTLGEATLTSSNLSISPSEVDIGGTVDIGVVVGNTGGCSGSYTVTLKINGVTEATKEVTVAGGASEEVVFTTVKDEAGSYSVDVNGLEGSFTVLEEPEPGSADTTPGTASTEPEQSPTPPQTTSSSGIDWRILGPVIGVAVFLGVFLPIRLRKRRAP